MQMIYVLSTLSGETLEFLFVSLYCLIFLLSVFVLQLSSSSLLTSSSSKGNTSRVFQVLWSQLAAAHLMLHSTGWVRHQSARRCAVHFDLVEGGSAYVRQLRRNFGNLSGAKPSLHAVLWVGAHPTMHTSATALTVNLEVC